MYSVVSYYPCTLHVGKLLYYSTMTLVVWGKNLGTDEPN